MSYLALLVWFFIISTAFADDATPSRRIYVPIEELDVIVAHDQRGVLLPRTEFEALLQKAKENAAQDQRPETALVVSKCDYTARIVEHQLVISATAEFRQFTDGWESIALPLDHLSVEKALLDDKAASLGRTAEGTLRLLSEGRGTHTLTLELSTELAAVGSDQAAAFGLLPAPAGTLTITLPAGKRLLVNGVDLERPAAIEEPAEYRIAVGGQQNVSLQITDRAAQQATEALVFATTGHGLNVSPGEVTWQAVSTIQVFGKPIDRVVFSVPNTLEIAAIDSSGLEAWELADDPQDGDRTQITLSYAQPFDDQRQVTLRGVMATPTDEAWTAPTLLIRNATSHIGQILVRHAPSVRVRVEESSGVRRTNENMTRVAGAGPEGSPGATDTGASQSLQPRPPSSANASATETLRFEIWREDFTLRFLTQPKERELQAAVASVLDINSTGLDLETSITVETRFAPLFELDLTLPVEWTVTGASVGGQPITWQMLSEEAGVRLVRLQFASPVAIGGSALVRLQAHQNPDGWPVEQEPVEFHLPEVYLPQASLSEGTLVVRGDADFDVTVGELTGLDPAPTKYDWERLRYVSQDTRFSGTLLVTRKPPRVAAQTLSFIRLDPNTLHTHFDILLNVQGGGLRTVRLVLPESAGDSLQFVTQSIGQTGMSVPPAHAGEVRIAEQKVSPVEDGERTWTLQFDRRVKGFVLLTADIETPRTKGEAVTPPAVRVVEAEMRNGYIALEAGPEQQLQITANTADGLPLSEVDPLDLPATQYHPQERIVAVFRHVASDYQLTVSEDRFDRLAVPTAVCHALTMTSILGETGEVQHRAAFQLTVVGVQSLRVELPEGASLWATVIDGRPVEVRRRDNVYLLPLPMRVAGAGPQGSPGSASAGASQSLQPRSPDTSSSNERRQLELFYTSHTKPLTRFSTVRESAPLVSVVSGQGKVQPLEVLEQDWNLYYPDDTLLIRSEGPLQPSQPLDHSGLLSQIPDGLRTPTPNDLLWNVLAVAVALGVIAVVVQLYRRRGVRGLLLGAAAMGLLGISVLIFYAFASQLRGNAEYYADKAAPASAPVSGTTSAPAAGGMPGGGFGGFAASEGVPAESAAATPPPPTAPKPEAAPNQPPPMAQEPAQAVDRLPLRHGAVADAPQQAGMGNQIALDRDAKSKAGGKLAAPRLGGLLSLTVNLTPPDGTLLKTFSYTGTETAENGLGLEVTLESRRAGRVYCLFLTVAVGLLFWFLRDAAPRRRWLLAIFGLTLPLALVSIVPPRWHIALDGLFFGTLVGLLLWLVDVVASRRWLAKPTNRDPRASGTTAIVLFAFGLAAMSNSSPAVADEKSPAASKDQLILPYTDPNDPLAANRVYLPHDKFMELWNRAHPDQRIKPAAPEQGLVAEALYDAELRTDNAERDRAQVRINARLALFNLTEHQITLTVPLGHVAVSAAKLDGKPAALVVKDHHLQVVLNEPGLHVLDLRFEVPAKLTGPAGQFTLPLSSVPSGKLTFTLPQKDLTVRVNGSGTAYRRRTEGEKTLVEIPVDRAAELTVTWQPEQARGDAAATVHAESTTAITIDDSGVLFSSAVRLRVRQGGLLETSFSLPPELRVQSISGPDVGGWELEGTGQERRLRVFFRRGIPETTQLTLDLYLGDRVGTEPRTITVPQVAPRNVVHETGTIGVFADEQFTVTTEEKSNITQIDAARFTKTEAVHCGLSTPPQLTFRFTSRPFTLQLRAVREAAKANIVARHGVYISRRKMRQTSRFTYDLSGAPRGSLSIELPEGYLLLSVNATDLSDWYVIDEDGFQTLIVELAGPRTGSVEVVLEGTVPKEPDAASVDLQFPRPQDFTRLDTQAAVWLEDIYSARLEQAEGWRPLDQNEVAAELRALQSLPVQLAFHTTDSEPLFITLNLDRATPQLTADSLSVITVTDPAVEYALALQWRIEQAATDALTITTPEVFAGKLDFQGPGIRQVTSDKIGGGRIRWTIHPRTPVRGRYFATATGSLPPAKDEVQAPSLEFQQPGAGPGADFAALATQRHDALLINLSQGQLTAVDPSRTETVQPEDLPLTVRQTLVDQATELVRVRDRATPPAWRLQRFAQEQGIPASVNVADLLTVVAEDGTWRGQATYTIKNRTRQFLALELPPGSRVLSVFVSGQPSRAVETTLNERPVQLVALPKTSEADLALQVVVVFAGRLPSGPLPRDFHILSQEIQLPVPQVVSVRESERFGIPVARTRWTVYLPDRIVAQPARGSDRNNLTWLPPEGADLTYAWATLQAVRELASVATNAASRRTRGEALNNLKQLEKSLDQSYIDSYNGRASGEAQQLAQEQEKERSKLSELKQQFETPPQVAKGAVITNGAVPLDEVRQMEIARQNTITLYGDNFSSAGVPGLQTNTEDFRFRLQPGEQAATKKDAEESKPLSKAAANAEARQKLRRKSEAQVEALNESILQNAMQQQGQQPQSQTQTTTPYNFYDTQRSARGGIMSGGRQFGGQQFGGQQPGFDVNGPAFGIDGMNRGIEDFAQVRLGANAVDGGFLAIEDAAKKAAARPWTRTGGLSLPITLPTTGHKLVFTKVGGEPKLSLLVRPRESLQTGFGWIWSLVWLSLGVAAAIAVSSPATRRRGLDFLPMAIALLGLIGFFLLPGALSWLSFGVFLVGCLWTGLRRQRGE